MALRDYFLFGRATNTAEGSINYYRLQAVGQGRRFAALDLTAVFLLANIFEAG
jgi:hypothetical protein